MSKNNSLLIIGIIILCLIYYQYGRLITNYFFILKEGLTSCPAGCAAPTELTGNCHGASDLHVTKSQIYSRLVRGESIGDNSRTFKNNDGTCYKMCPYVPATQNDYLNRVDCTSCGFKKVTSQCPINYQKEESKPVKVLLNSNYSSQISNKEFDTLNMSNNMSSQQSQQLQEIQDFQRSQQSKQLQEIQDFQRSQQSKQLQQSKLRDDLSILVPSENISTVANSSIKSYNLDKNMTDIKTLNCKCYT